MRSRFVSKSVAAAAAGVVVAAAALAVGPAAARADVVVDTELGTLGAGAHPFAGTTVGQTNDVDTYSLHNTAAIWDQDFTYRFTTTATMRASITTNDPDGVIDNDFFLFSNPTTTVNSNGLREAQIPFEGIFVSGTFGVIPAGTHFLSVDAWRGNPTVVGTPPTGRAGPFQGTFTLATISAPGSTQVMLGGSVTGALGPGEIDWFVFDYNGSGGFVIDTEGSMFAPQNDTELALFDSQGTLLASDDDGGSGALSRLPSPANLPAGTYYLAMAGFNTEFEDGWGAITTSTEPDFGTYVINGLSIPEPTAMALLPLAGLLVARRRR